MEKPTNHQILLSETLGTFILSSAISYSAAYSPGQVGNIFAIFAGFYMALTVTREISGAHLNPGVSVTLLLATDGEKRKRALRNGPFYLCAQLLGAFIAPVLCYFLYNQNLFKLDISPNTSSLKALLAEILGSTVFYTAILIQGGMKLADKEKTLSTLTVALGLLAGIGIACNISGAGLNPAIALGFQLSRAIILADFSELSHSWLYILGPLIASYLSSTIYDKMYVDGPENPKKEPFIKQEEN